MKAILSFYVCRLSGGDSQRWWGHSNPTCCNQICLNLLYSLKHLACALMPECARSRLNHLMRLSLIRSILYSLTRFKIFSTFRYVFNVRPLSGLSAWLSSNGCQLHLISHGFCLRYMKTKQLRT